MENVGGVLLGLQYAWVWDLQFWEAMICGWVDVLGRVGFLLIGA